MKPHEDKLTLIEKAFRYAHSKRRICAVTPEWEKNVMFHILSLRAIPPQTANSVWETPAIWRMAAAVSLSALIILATSILSDANAEYEAARFLIEDPVTFIFTQPFFP
jgi:hypothetical protein